MPTTTGTRDPLTWPPRNRWFLPAFCVFLGLCYLVAWSLGGDVGAGFVGLGIMSALGAVFLLGGRSETIRGLRGDGRDERFAQIDLTATAVAGSSVIVAIIVGLMVELGRGGDGSPYSWLAAVGGVTYVAAILWLRRRS